MKCEDCGTAECGLLCHTDEDAVLCYRCYAARKALAAEQRGYERCRQDAAAVCDTARKFVSDFDGLVAESQGVDGLHMNGNLAPWDSLLAGGHYEEWLMSLEDLRAALLERT